MRHRRQGTALDTLRRGMRSFLLASIAALAGCTITQTGTPLPERLAITPGVTTKLEVYQGYGLPRAIHYSGADQILVYDFRQGKGMGFGIGALGIWFRFQHVENGTDTLAVRVGPEGRVVEVDASYRLKNTGFWFWPFGG